MEALGGVMSFDLRFYKEKKVLLTGHTGFKGAWMSTMLVNAGAKVIGYSSCSKTEERLFDLCGVKDQIAHIKGDVRNLDFFSFYILEFIFMNVLNKFMNKKELYRHHKCSLFII